MFRRGRVFVLVAAAVVLATAGVVNAAPQVKTPPPAFAQVNYDGTLLAGSTGIGSVQQGTGTYLITAGRDVSRCGIVVTSGRMSEAGVAVGGVTAEVINSDPTTPSTTSFRVLESVGGTPADYSFSLVIVC